MQRLARDQRAGMFQEHEQNLQRLVLQVDSTVPGSQLPRTSIQLEVTETDRVWKVGAELHVSTRSVSKF